MNQEYETCKQLFRESLKDFVFFHNNIFSKSFTDKEEFCGGSHLNNWCRMLQESKHTCILAPRKHSKCLAKGTKIQMRSGMLKSIEKIRKGNVIVSFKGNNQIYSKVTNIFNLDKKEALELVSKSGFKIIAANTHYFLTKKGWKQLSDLKIKDKIAVARNIQIRNKYRSMPTYEAKFIAYMLAEGGLKNRNVSFTNNNHLIMEEFEQIAKKLGFNIKFKSERDNQAILLNNKISKYKYFKRYNLWKKSSYTKQIPNQIFSLPIRDIALFINRLWACDGWASIKSRTRLGYCSNSSELINGIKLLLLRFGIHSYISKYGNNFKLNIHKGKESIKFFNEIEN